MLLSMMGSGCGSQKTAPQVVQRGVVNLDILVRHHPGWSGVGQYDTELERLEIVKGGLQPTSQADERSAILPALMVNTIPSTGLPQGYITGISRRLGSVQNTLITNLRQRRERERREQLRQERQFALSEANRLFAISVGNKEYFSDLDLQMLHASLTQLSITAANWSQSIPPAPILVALRAKILRDHARLETLLAERSAQRASAIEERRNEVATVRAARAAYVQGKMDILEARLMTDDEKLIAVQKSDLTESRAALLQILSRSEPVSVPPVGDVAALTLPRGPKTLAANLSPSSVASTKARLLAQRARWLKFLFDDTEAAAKDTAQAKHWDVTFGAPRPGQRDLTGSMAQAMAAGIWRL